MWNDIAALAITVSFSCPYLAGCNSLTIYYHACQYEFPWCFTQVIQLHLADTPTVSPIIFSRNTKAEKYNHWGNSFPNGFNIALPVIKWTTWWVMITKTEQNTGFWLGDDNLPFSYEEPSLCRHLAMRWTRGMHWGFCHCHGFGCVCNFFLMAIMVGQ